MRPPSDCQASGCSAGVKTVGYIGPGNAGFSIASNLPKAGYRLVVHDVDSAKAQRAANEWKNTTASDGEAEAFSECDGLCCHRPSAFEKVEPVLRCMARYIFAFGKLGAGHAMKTLNNYVMASSICALSDSLAVGQKYGLDPQTMIDALNVGTGVCFPTLDTFRRDGITGRFESGFGLALLVKDLGITEEFMEHNGLETELPSLTKRYLADALKEVEPDAGRSGQASN
ncbi:hypothetical protein LTR15_008253 [Elasticomyces elasticus]|nr:hypothetical protein LTR15_008253 [Elasticomyces elasticus]